MKMVRRASRQPRCLTSDLSPPETLQTPNSHNVDCGSLASSTQKCCIPPLQAGRYAGQLKHALHRSTGSPQSGASRAGCKHTQQQVCLIQSMRRLNTSNSVGWTDPQHVPSQSPLHASRRSMQPSSIAAQRRWWPNSLPLDPTKYPPFCPHTAPHWLQSACPSSTAMSLH